MCEPCTYSPGSVEDSLPTLSSDTLQLSLLSGIDTPVKSSEKEQQKDGSPICQCGKWMSECSIHPNTPEKWIASMQASLAKILASPENKQALAKKQGVASTVKSSASLAWFDPDTCSWKTSQQSLLTDSEQSSVTWPRSGMTANGYAYRLPRLALPTKETDFGFLATPTTISNQLMPSMMKHKSCRALARAIHDRKKCASPSEYNRNEPGIAVILGGMPHPTFQEWQMGWPIEWTGLKQLAMGKSRSKPQSHGNCSEANDELP